LARDSCAWTQAELSNGATWEKDTSNAQRHGTNPAAFAEPPAAALPKENRNALLAKMTQALLASAVV
jgi:hypothetical protein